jgi:hypothetical protein
MFRTLGTLLAALALCGCAVTPPAPLQKPATPSALVSDGATGGGRQGGVFFYVAEMDGVEVKGNILRSSLVASSGRGMDMRLQEHARYLPAGKHRLKLKGQQAYAAPIQGLFSSASSRAVEGVVEVDLQDDVRYRVNGVLDAFRREIWLEEAQTGKLVGVKIENLARDEATQKAMAGASYTCCNLRYEDDWISDANWAGLPIIPPGARIKVVEHGSNRVRVLIDGRPFRMGLDYGRQQLNTEQFMARLMVPADPTAAIAAYPEAVRRAIAAGQVMPGMNKAQVTAALGPARADATTGPNALKWVYWTIDDESYTLEWNEQGVLQKVVAAPAVLAKVEFKP